MNEEEEQEAERIRAEMARSEMDLLHLDIGNDLLVDRLAKWWLAKNEFNLDYAIKINGLIGAKLEQFRQEANDDA